jgi:hypothetical protein
MTLCISIGFGLQEETFMQYKMKYLAQKQSPWLQEGEAS